MIWAPDTLRALFEVHGAQINSGPAGDRLPAGGRRPKASERDHLSGVGERRSRAEKGEIQLIRVVSGTGMTGSA